jgi:hypothetical protein
MYTKSNDILNLNLYNNSMNDGTLEVSEGDMRASQKKELLLDAQRNIRVISGIPADKVFGAERGIFVPQKPHVFKVDELHVNDPKHDSVSINDAVVLLAHGIQTPRGWEFNGGQGVRETVDAYEEYARQNNEPRLDFVLACNEDGSPNPLDIRIGDLGARNDIAYAVGDTVRIRAGNDSSVDENGKVKLTVSSSKEFFNLDTVMVKKSIQI